MSSRAIREASRAGASRTTERDGAPPRTLVTIPTDAPPGDDTGPKSDGPEPARVCPGRKAPLSDLTTRGGDAVPRNAETGPAHRHVWRSEEHTSELQSP